MGSGCAKIFCRNSTQVQNITSSNANSDVNNTNNETRIVRHAWIPDTTETNNRSNNYRGKL